MSVKSLDPDMIVCKQESMDHYHNVVSYTNYLETVATRILDRVLFVQNRDMVAKVKLLAV